MVADGEDCRHERFPVLGRLVDYRQRIVEEVFVGHAKTIGHLVGRVVLLCINLVVAIGAEEGIHVVVLRLMSHKEQVVISLLMEHRSNTAAVWCHCTLHQVAHHQGRKGVQRGGDAMVGMYACGVETGESQTVLIQTIKSRCEPRLLSEGLHQTCRHRLHQNNHHIGVCRHRVGRHLPTKQSRTVGNSCQSHVMPDVCDSLVIGQELQFGILLPHPIQRTGDEVE